MKNKSVSWKELTIRFYNRPITGSFSVSDGMVTVNSPYGSETAQLGPLGPHIRARMMMIELVKNSQATSAADSN